VPDGVDAGVDGLGVRDARELGALVPGVVAARVGARADEVDPAREAV
jgi:hypothetical protein